MRFLRDDDDDDEGLLFGDFLGPFVSNDDDDKGGDVDVGASKAQLKKAFGKMANGKTTNVATIQRQNDNPMGGTIPSIKRPII